MEVEFAVGYLCKPGFGAPFAPMSREEALRALPSLRKLWTDAVLIVREDGGAWRKATAEEAK